MTNKQKNLLTQKIIGLGLLILSFVSVFLYEGDCLMFITVMPISLCVISTKKQLFDIFEEDMEIEEDEEL